MMRSKLSNLQGITRKYGRSLSLITVLCVLFVTGGSYSAQSNRSRRPVTTNGDKMMPLDVSDVYKVEEIRFDPMAAGRNKASIKFRNLTDRSQRVGIRIQTNTRGAGWGSSHFGCDLAPLQEKWYRFHFTVRNDFIGETWIQLRFCNPPSSLTLEDGCQEIRFYGSELERRKPDTDISLPATPELAAEITSRFQEFQDMLRHERYDEAWNVLTRPFQEAEFLGAKGSFKWVLNLHKPSRKEQYLRLKPKEVVKEGSRCILYATLDQDQWKIVFATDEGQWKIDAIEGYLRPSKRDSILATMQNRTARHFDIYYKKKSTAERDIEKIVAERDSGYDEICKFLGIEPNIGITLIFFEDMESKRNETGHQGAGMASGTNIVEVYNQTMRLDPFHETTHILARRLGRPPAIFNEGLATYMSERLGAPPLKELGGGESSLYERAQELRSKGDWIALEELLTYTEIGPGWSRPPVAYPEAGAFVKFLIDTYGKEKFLQAYKSLVSSKTRSVLEQNEAKLEKIYGISLADLEKQWIRTLEMQDCGPVGIVVSPRIEAAAKVLREFLSGVREKDYEKAWSLTSEYFKQTVLKGKGFEEFKTGADKMANVYGTATVYPELSTVSLGGNPAIRIMGPFIKREMYFIFVEEDGQWKLLTGHNK
jgi:hypothetical protein